MKNCAALEMLPSFCGGKPLEVRDTAGRLATSEREALVVDEEVAVLVAPFLRRGAEATDFCIPEVVEDLSSAAQPLLLLGSRCSPMGGIQDCRELGVLWGSSGRVGAFRLRVGKFLK